MSVMATCAKCGAQRKVRPDRVAQLCKQCRKQIPEPTERDALTGGTWQVVPGSLVRRWVPDEEQAA